MCIITGIIKCILGILVGFIMSVGLILLVVGGVLLWGMNSIMPHIYDITSYVKTMLKNLNISDAGVKNLETLISANSATVGAIAIALGVILFTIAVLGYMSLCCFDAKCFLVVLIILINIVLAGIIALAILYVVVGSDKILVHVEKGLYKLVRKYRGYNATNMESVVINVVQTQAHCCGIFNYTDFRFAKDWMGGKAGHKFPLSCCESRNLQFVDVNECMRTWQSPTMNVGCYGLVKPYLEKYLSYTFLGLIISIAVLVVIDGLFIIFACCDGTKSPKNPV